MSGSVIHSQSAARVPAVYSAGQSPQLPVVIDYLSLIIRQLWHFARCRWFIDRNLNPQKTKKAPQNGCFFNTPCAPYERKRLLNRMTLIDTGYEWRFFAPFPVKWTQLPLCGSQPHTCCRASRSCIRTSSASR